MNPADDQYADERDEEDRPASDEDMQDAFAEYMSDRGNEYGEWLMNRRADLMICNGDDLIRRMESATDFDEFIREKKHGVGQ